MTMYEFTAGGRHYTLPARVAFAIHVVRTIRAPVFLMYVPMMLLVAFCLAYDGGVLQVLALSAVMLVVAMLFTTAESMRSMLLSGVHQQYIASVVHTTKAGEYLARRYSSRAA